MLNIVVYGCGKTGKCVAELLQRQGKDFRFFDDASICPKIERDEFVIISPGIKPTAMGLMQARRCGATVCSELDYCLPLCRGRCISVTGTNGKTTTCEMLYRILGSIGSAWLLGNGGVPFSHSVDDVKSTDAVVLESSSFQLCTCRSFAPYIAVFTNLAVDHLDYHKGLWSYARAKCNNFRYQSRDQIAVFNADDAGLVNLSDFANSKVVYYSLSNTNTNCFINGNSVVVRLNGKEYREGLGAIADMLLHNKSNALAAITAAVCYGVSLTQCVEALQGFTPSPHRLQRIACLNGVTFVDDSKGTNVHATKSAVACFDEPLVLIVGGSDKGENFERLFPLQKNVTAVFAVGQTAAKIARVGNDYGCIVTCMDNYAVAIRRAYELLRVDGGGVVLMSNACASFDAFSSYAERGAFFCDVVKELIDEQSSNEL